MDPHTYLTRHSTFPARSNVPRAVAGVHQEHVVAVYLVPVALRGGVGCGERR